jgi:hypothetical protein
MGEHNTIYRTDVRLDKEAVLRGMNGLHLGEKVAGLDVYIADFMVCGQHSELPIGEETEEGPDALRVILLYCHLPSNQVGILQEEISYRLLREFAEIGMATR